MISMSIANVWEQEHDGASKPIPSGFQPEKSQMSKVYLAVNYMAITLLVSSALVANAQEQPSPKQSVKARITAPRVVPDEPTTDTLPVAPEPRCDAYARSAVEDFRTMQRFAQCLIRNNARWQPNYQAHYGWCIANRAQRPEWIQAEARARTDHLIKCGVRKNY